MLQTILFLTDSVFFALCACFDDSMAFFDDFFAIEKLEYSRYNARTKYEFVFFNTYCSDLVSYTNGSHEGFVEFCVIEVFKFWVILQWMKE